jgi:hypothetical protein
MGLDLDQHSAKQGPAHMVAEEQERISLIRSRIEARGIKAKLVHGVHSDSGRGAAAVVLTMPDGFEVRIHDPGNTAISAWIAAAWHVGVPTD